MESSTLGYAAFSWKCLITTADWLRRYRTLSISGPADLSVLRESHSTHFIVLEVRRGLLPGWRAAACIGL
jgi:hypothetical protein